MCVACLFTGTDFFISFSLKSQYLDRPGRLQTKQSKKKVRIATTKTIYFNNCHVRKRGILIKNKEKKEVRRIRRIQQQQKT